MRLHYSTHSTSQRSSACDRDTVAAASSCFTVAEEVALFCARSLLQRISEVCGGSVAHPFARGSIECLLNNAPRLWRPSLRAAFPGILRRLWAAAGAFLRCCGDRCGCPEPLHSCYHHACYHGQIPRHSRRGRLAGQLVHRRQIRKFPRERSICRNCANRAGTTGPLLNRPCTTQHVWGQRDEAQIQASVTGPSSLADHAATSDKSCRCRALRVGCAAVAS